MPTYNQPANLSDIRTKIRRITGRPTQQQISDTEIDKYINTFYVFDLSEHLRMESLRTLFQFTTNANVAVYDFDTEFFITNMPPVYIGGYQSYATQSRDNFYRINPQLNYLQQQVSQGDGTEGPYNFTLTNTPILQGYKPNPPGAFNPDLSLINPEFINWNVMISAPSAPNADGISNWNKLVDDGLGNLVSTNDAGPFVNALDYNIYGNINYITGAVTIQNFVDVNLNPIIIPAGNPINAQYVPYVASRPQSILFYQDQFILYPVPDQAYTVSLEVYKYPFPLDSDNAHALPQVLEWWQALAYGAADKIFTDNADFESAAKFRPLLDEQLRLIERRTIVQQTSERTSSIYAEQSGFFQYPFGNLYSGF